MASATTRRSATPIFHVEWRFTPGRGRQEEQGYNSGLYSRNSADAKVWHQAQTGDASGGFLFGETAAADGKPVRFNLSKQVTDKRVKPAGEWNTFEITCKGKQLSLWVNGAQTCGARRLRPRPAATSASKPRGTGSSSGT